MRKLFFSSVVSVALLSACSSVVPPVTVQDPLALQGKQVSSSVVTSKGNVQVSSVGARAINVEFAATFPDVSQSFASFDVTQALDGTATVDTPGTLPASFAITKVELTGAVKDASNTTGSGTPIVLTATVPGGVMFTQSGTDPNTYVFDAAKLKLSGGPSDFNAFRQVVTTGGDNVFTATMKAWLAAPNDAAFGTTTEGTTITFTFAAGTASVRVF
jgi:hypothetical protein